MFFTANGMMKPFVDRTPVESRHWKTFLTASLANVTLLPIIIPVELFKCRAQSRRTASEEISLATDIRRTYQRFGLQGCYKGGAITASREVPGVGILLAVKEALEDKFGVVNEERSYFRLAKKIAAASIGGFCAWCLSIPMDTVKTVIQSDPKQNRHVWETTKGIYKQQGLKYFYKGMVPQTFRIVP